MLSGGLMEPLITVPGESWKVKGTMRKLERGMDGVPVVPTVASES